MFSEHVVYVVFWCCIFSQFICLLVSLHVNLMLLQFCLRLSQDGSGRGAAIVAAVASRLGHNN